MSSSARDRFLTTTATLIARQKAAVARHRANGWGDTLAESLLGEMERSARLVRERPRSSKGTCVAIARQALDSSYLATVAHELRNHLQCLMLDLNRIPSTTHASAANVGTQQAIEGALTLMTLLSCDLAIASEMIDEEPNWFLGQHPVARLFKEVAELLAPVAWTSKIQMNIAPIAGPLRIWCDWDRTWHAMIRLVLKVLRATPCGGRITLSAQLRHGAVRFAIAPDRTYPATPEGAAANQPIDLQYRLASALIEAQRGRVWSGQALGREHHIYVAMPSDSEPMGTARAG